MNKCECWGVTWLVFIIFCAVPVWADALLVPLGKDPHLTSHILTSSIRALFENAQGQFFVSANGLGVFVFKNELFTPVPVEEPDRFQSIRCFVVFADGDNVFLSTNTNTLLRLAFTNTAYAPDLNGVRVRGALTEYSARSDLHAELVANLWNMNENGLLHKKQLNYCESPLFWPIVAALVIVLSTLAIYVSVRLKTRNLQRRQQEYKEITDQALSTIAHTIDAKDSYTNGHSERVASYSREIARRLGMDTDEQEKTYYIALLHDIGKIGIPDAILNKPSPLTDAEYAVMRRHTYIGADILKNFHALPDIEQGALCHHELYNGQGYPNGTVGEAIPRIGRIICVADAYDAMATKRAYREAMDRKYTISELEKNSGVQFDPEIVRVMVDIVREMKD